MSKEGRFLVYCLQIYAVAKGVGAHQAYEMLERSDAIGYIMRNYEALHTTGEAYIVNDIDRYLETH